MEEDKVPLQSRLCRLCLEYPGVVDIFDKTELVQDIYLCTGVKIHETNNLPRKVCTKCLEIVTNAKELRILVEANETQMRVLFDNGNDLDHGINKTNNENEDTSSSSDDEGRLYIDEKFVTDDRSDEDIKITKRKEVRSSSSENSEEPLTKISVRKDLLKPKYKNISSKKQANTESTKKVISKNCKTKSDVNATYTCAWCTKTFTTSKKLYCHQRLHNKNIPCPKKSCEKKFSTKGDMEKHFRTHTGERPYSCDICDKSFTQRGTLKTHKETVHQNETLVVY